VLTELGRLEVEVQRCSLSLEGPRLRSSGAQCVRKLAKSLAQSWQGGSGHGVEAEVVEEKEEEKNNSDKI